MAGAPKNSFVSEWFGHRVYPSIASGSEALADQKSKRCPFLSAATAETKQCVKGAASMGICTISSCSNGPRQDWLVCPYRALDPSLLDAVVRRIFQVAKAESILIVSAPTVEHGHFRAEASRRLAAGERVFVYMQDKLGGEISLSATRRSPELSFDVTIIELKLVDGHVQIDRYGILEVQTMDFHGSYRNVVKNLEDALRLHSDTFAQELERNSKWLSDRIEGPNIANVFKRTFYQMVMKFQMAGRGACAGAVLAIPLSVWDSWQRHLGAPDLADLLDGTHGLSWPGAPADTHAAWIYVFDLDSSSASTPSPVVLTRAIMTNADSVAHYALRAAPEAGMTDGGVDRVLATIRRRLTVWWPELR